MSKPDLVFNLLGLAHRARRLSLGMTATAKTIRFGETKMLLLAGDLSQNAKSKITSAAAGKRLPVLSISTKDYLGQRLGRKEVGIIGVNDAGFAASIRKAIEANGPGRAAEK